MNIIKIILIIINIIITIFKKKTYAKNINKNITNNNIPSLSIMLEKILPSVINIHTEGIQKKNTNTQKEFKNFIYPEIPNNNIKKFYGLGSGVIIDSNNGYIVTNNHVINEADKIKAQINDGREFEVKLIGQDEQTDIALLKIINPKKLIEIKIADSDKIKIGDYTIAIGNPFGLGQTVTSGIISALGRSGLNIDGLENFIQTDASINKGNSGGALINLKGELIGINTAILTPGIGNIGIGFAIPSNIIKNLTQQLIKYGEIKRGQLGIKGIELTSDIAKEFNIETHKGTFVSEVMIGSAASKSGIKSGDIIISIEGKRIQNFAELKMKIGTTTPGNKIKLGIIRNGKPKIILVTIDDNSTNISYSEETLIPFLKGANLKNIELKNGDKGIFINNIIKNSPAEYTGLLTGDIIIGVNKNKIKNIHQLKNTLKKNFSIIALNIIRNNNNIYIIIKK